MVDKDLPPFLTGMQKFHKCNHNFLKWPKNAVIITLLIDIVIDVNNPDTVPSQHSHMIKSIKTFVRL